MNGITVVVPSVVVPPGWVFAGARDAVAAGGDSAGVVSVMLDLTQLLCGLESFSRVLGRVVTLQRVQSCLGHSLGSHLPVAGQGVPRRIAWRGVSL